MNSLVRHLASAMWDTQAFFTWDEAVLFYPHFIQQKASSFLRILLGNISFLILALVWASEIKDVIARTALIAHVSLWLVASMAFAIFLVAPLTISRTMYDYSGLPKAEPYRLLCVLVMTLRVYVLLFLVFEANGLTREPFGLCGVHSEYISYAFVAINVS